MPLILTTATLQLGLIKSLNTPIIILAEVYHYPPSIKAEDSKGVTEVFGKNGGFCGLALLPVFMKLNGTFLSHN